MPPSVTSDHPPTEKSLRQGNLVGYARVSTHDQNIRSQVKCLQEHGVDKKRIFTDTISGSKAERPGLDACLQSLQRGDVLVVWRLDRLGRSIRHLVDLVDTLQQKGVGLRSLSDGIIDTTSASGRLIFGIFSVLAEFERELIRERTMAGLKAARARGRRGGRRPLAPDDPKVFVACQLYANKNLPISKICQQLSISKPTLYRRLRVGGVGSARGG